MIIYIYNHISVATTLYPSIIPVALCTVSYIIGTIFDLT